MFLQRISGLYFHHYTIEKINMWHYKLYKRVEIHRCQSAYLWEQNCTHLVSLLSVQKHRSKCLLNRIWRKPTPYGITWLKRCENVSTQETSIGTEIQSLKSLAVVHKHWALMRTGSQEWECFSISFTSVYKLYNALMFFTGSSWRFRVWLSDTFLLHSLEFFFSLTISKNENIP